MDESTLPRWLSLESPAFYRGHTESSMAWIYSSGISRLIIKSTCRSPPGPDGRHVKDPRPIGHRVTRVRHQSVPSSGTDSGSHAPRRSRAADALICVPGADRFASLSGLVPVEEACRNWASNSGRTTIRRSWKAEIEGHERGSEKARSAGGRNRATPADHHFVRTPLVAQHF